MTQSLAQWAFKAFCLLLALVAPAHAAGPGGGQLPPWGLVIELSPAEVEPGPEGSMLSQILGAKRQRAFAISLEDWRRSGTAACKVCERFIQPGISRVISVRSQGKTSQGRLRAPSQPPSDLFAYRKALVEVLQAFKPETVFIEDREDTLPGYFDGSRLQAWDTPEDGKDTVDLYLAQLTQGCDVAKQLKIRCANGGLSWRAAVLLTWSNYIKIGKTNEACRFAERALASKGNPTEAERFCRAKVLDAIPGEERKQLAGLKRLIDGFRISSLDYMNIEFRGWSPEALTEVVGYLRAATGKSVGIHEFPIATKALKEPDSAIAALLTTMAELRLPYVYLNLLPEVESLISKKGDLLEPGAKLKAILKP